MSLTNSEKIVKAIQTINPNAKVIVGDSIDKITWVEDTTPIPTADIQVELDKINSTEDPEGYRNKRLREYPHWQECIHALLEGGDVLSDLQAKRQAIKDKYPKE